MSAVVDTLGHPDPATSMNSRAPNLYTLHGALLTAIRRHFAQEGNLENAEVQNYVWNADDKLSKILIESVYRWNPTNIQQRPAVIVKRGPWKLTPIGLGNRYHGTPAPDGYVEDSHFVSAAGTHTFFCLGTSGLEADVISMEVIGCLLGFSQVIREQLCLGSFLITDVGPISKLDECQDHFGVPVNVEYAMQWNWNLLRQSPIWARTDSHVSNV